MEMEDGVRVETVFMKYKYGNSVCISSQAGCRMGCVFCASGMKGLERSLSAGEMYGQILAIENETNEKISHIVVMGIGEPMDNYESLSAFLNIINDPKGKNLSMRNITVSTSGLIPKIEQFAEDFPQVNLAISLHRLTDEGRALQEKIKEVPGKVACCLDLAPEKAQTLYTLLYELLGNQEERNKANFRPERKRE
jgi:23S rRNA (adenine2503-C2)-methyltransferase